MLELFVTGFLLSLSLCLDIGIVNVALINTGIAAGVRPALLLGLGSCVGDLFYAALSLAGIGVLLRFEAVRWLLWLGGGALLLYLAASAARAALRPVAAGPDAATVAAGAGAQAQFLRGLWLALASPSSIIWFAAVGGSLIAHSGADSAAGLGALFGGFFCAGLAWSAAIAVLAAHGGRAIGPRLRHYCHALSALLFTYFAVKVLIDGYRQLP